jgi:hypothetical protein
MTPEANENTESTDSEPDPLRVLLSILSEAVDTRPAKEAVDKFEIVRSANVVLAPFSKTIKIHLINSIVNFESECRLAPFF